MKYDELFKVNEDGIGCTITGLLYKFHVDEEEKVISLTLYYDVDSKVSLYAPEGKDISALLLHLMLVVPSRPCLPYKESNVSEIVGDIVKAFYLEDMGDITVHTLSDTPCVKISAMDDDDRMFVIRYSEQSKTCSFSMTDSDGSVILDFSRSLDMKFSQFVECFE